MINEWFQRFRPAKIKPFNGQFYYFSRAPVGIINALRFVYFYLYYQWSNPHGPVFVVKLSMRLLDHFCDRLCTHNQKPICRKTFSPFILSKKAKFRMVYNIEVFIN